jgi:hypothetical protein
VKIPRVTDAGAGRRFDRMTSPKRLEAIPAPPHVAKARRIDY